MCVILYTEINGKKILAKNRDIPHNPNVELVHELVNGVEVAYIKDLTSGWVEGMNGDGIGIINSTLTTHKGKRNFKKKIIFKNNKIYQALCKTTKKGVLEHLIKQTKNGKIIRGVEGHTLLSIDDTILHIEQNVNEQFTIETPNNPSVYSNHRLKLKEGGFTEGKKGLSSFLRKKIVETELNNVEIYDLYDDILNNIMNVNCTNIHPKFHSYRDKNTTIKYSGDIDPNQIFISTTGQVILNTTDKEFVYYSDIHNSKSVKYINNLPTNYVPKIRVIIKETEKNIKNKKRCFTSKYLNKIYKKFNYTNKKHNYTKKSRK